MNKKFLLFSGVLLALSFVVLPVFAETNGTSPSPTATKAEKAAAKAADVIVKIACVKTAVAVREVALSAAVVTQSQAVAAAYSTRANELAGAYSNTTAKTLQVGMKVAWADFNKSVKAAGKALKTNQKTAWTAFKAAVKACNAPSNLSDASNSGSEVKGD